MPSTALITGASAGIGKEFARYHASLGGDLIITARREDALVELKTELETRHAITVHVVPLDLGADGGAGALIKAVDALGIDVDILINNAGFGGRGHHLTRDINDELSMIDLNVKALVALAHHFGRNMAANGGGKILNVGSTAGFMPGPNQAVYFATKAFVNSFSQAINYEMSDQGVTSIVLAPGYVETEFADRADLTDTALTKGGATAKSVAKFGYDAMMAGKLVVVNDRKLGFLVNWIIPFLPRKMVQKMMSDMQAK